MAVWTGHIRDTRSERPGGCRANDTFDPLVTAFRQGLKELGYVEGQNIVIEFRSAEGRNEELPKLVTELLRLPVAVMVCNVTAASAAKAITTRVPIVFATGGADLNAF